MRRTSSFHVCKKKGAGRAMELLAGTDAEQYPSCSRISGDDSKWKKMSIMERSRIYAISFKPRHFFTSQYFLYCAAILQKTNSLCEEALGPAGAAGRVASCRNHLEEVHQIFIKSAKIEWLNKIAFCGTAAAAEET